MFRNLNFGPRRWRGFLFGSLLLQAYSGTWYHDGEMKAGGGDGLLSRWMLSLLVISLPLTVIGEWLHWSEILLFWLACLAIIPLAGLMGQATESIAILSGPRIGGLLNATFGNAVELIIGFFAIRQGLVQVVQASLTGSILGNLLLVAGLSFLIGGIRYPIQTFNRLAAGTNASMMLIGVVIALVIPAIFTLQRPAIGVELSVGVAAITWVLYLLGLFFSLFTHRNIFNYAQDLSDEEAPWGMARSVGVLVVATLAVAYESEILVGTIEHVSKAFGWSDVFIGVIVVAIIGNAAEHSSAVLMAWRDRMDVSLEIAIGSSLQIAMFVAPLLVFTSLAVGNPMTLVFSWPEIAAMVLGVALITLLSLDGKSNWLEGAMALGAYVIMGIGFYLI
ncbi:H+/Ca2+ antiporter [Kyrpidia spormannii]|uniref:H+/Ca2+ antiporter n=3 Tax=Kyrpidia spormannii TaxID=2055160 RepID=A0ACA8Z7E5_9BACL|nr:H+/Ca2+ antiporter [Kyrpidia spormannii]CAB3391725.1 H+/Ca2+ antiporter [Kyrpidia spormannii]